MSYAAIRLAAEDVGGEVQKEAVVEDAGGVIQGAGEGFRVADAPLEQMSQEHEAAEIAAWQGA